MKVNVWIVCWLIAALIIIAGAVATAMQYANAQFLITLGIVFFFVMAFSYYRRKNMPKPDERDKKIQTKAMAYSWYITYMFIAILILYNQWISNSLNPQAALGIIFAFMIISQIALRWHFSKKGDA